MLRTNTVGHDVCVRRAMMYIQYDYVHYERRGADQHDYTDIHRYKHTHTHLYTDMIVDDSAELLSLLRANVLLFALTHNAKSAALRQPAALRQLVGEIQCWTHIEPTRRRRSYGTATAKNIKMIASLININHRNIGIAF